MGTVGVAIDVTQERVYEQEIVQKNQTLEKIFTLIKQLSVFHQELYIAHNMQNFSVFMSDAYVGW